MTRNLLAEPDVEPAPETNTPAGDDPPRDREGRVLLHGLSRAQLASALELDAADTERVWRALYRELESPKMSLPKDRNADVAAMAAVNASVSRSRKRLCITVTNQSYSDTIPLSVEVREAEIATLAGRVLTASAATAENSFEHPKSVAPARLDLTPDGNTFQYDLPPHSFAAFLVSLR